MKKDQVRFKDGGSLDQGRSREQHVPQGQRQAPQIGMELSDDCLALISGGRDPLGGVVNKIRDAVEHGERVAFELVNASKPGPFLP